MKILVRCIVSKMGATRWVLQGGEVYEGEIIGDRVSITNHYNEVVELSLKEFSLRCKIIKKIG